MHYEIIRTLKTSNTSIYCMVATIFHTWNWVKKPDLPDTGSTWWSSPTLWLRDLTGRLVSPHIIVSNNASWINSYWVCGKMRKGNQWKIRTINAHVYMHDKDINNDISNTCTRPLKYPIIENKIIPLRKKVIENPNKHYYKISSRHHKHSIDQFYWEKLMLLSNYNVLPEADMYSTHNKWMC